MASYTTEEVKERGLQVEFDPSKPHTTPFVIPQKPFPRPASAIDKASQDEDKKKKLKKEEKEKYLEKLKKLTAKLEAAGVEADDESDSEDEKVLINEVEMKQDSNEVVLPQIGGIEHPLYVGTNKAFDVTVGSRAWLHTYDELRATRWSQKYLEEWKKRSADIVLRDALYNVVDETTGINHIEEFCMGFPDASRQVERLDHGYAKLINDIRLQSRSDPFVRTTNEKGQEVCPPNFDFQFRGGIRMKNFLRHWTSFNSATPMYDVVGDTATQVYECAPPANMKYSWVPLEWRKDIEEAYNLTKFNYIAPEDFKAYIVTLTKPEKLDSRLRVVDELNRPHITVQLANGGAARLFLGQVKLNFSPCIARDGMKEGELSLREWCELMEVQDDFYPLISVLLNVRAPDQDGTPKDPYAYSRYIYNHIADKNGTKRRRMYADAPLRLFQQQMIKRYSGSHTSGESFDDCKERFVQNVFKACVQTGLDTSLRTDFVLDTYRSLIEKLFEYGGNRECYNPVVGFGSVELKGGVNSPGLILDYQDVLSKTPEEKNAILRDYLRWFAQDQRKYVLPTANRASFLNSPSW